MDSRERLQRIIAREKADRCGLWLGCPTSDAERQLVEHVGAPTLEAARIHYHDDFRWITPQWCTYRHPEGKDMFFLPDTQHLPLGTGGPLASCESVEEVMAFEFPSADHLDFSEVIESLRNAGDVYRASGMWCCFFHNVMNYFGLEQYFVMMHTHPEVVQAATDAVCGFYLDANERFFEAAGTLIDASFMGNDLGTQRSLFISPDLLEIFVLPYLEKFVAQSKRHGYQVILHSCGAVSELIPRFIEMGVDCLHPLQAKAVGMDAQSLSSYKGRLAFMGGIDTQDMLVNCTPQEIRAEVQRVKSLIGPNLIVSPSHEGVLPNVPPENLAAMAEEAICG
jgi:uroporphyrinogen decarboxylase